MTKYEVECVEWTFDKDSNLDIFEEITNTSEPMKKLVTGLLLIFSCYQVDPKKYSSVLFNGGDNTKPYFILLVFWLAKS
jgi:hypothetical protein